MSRTTRETPASPRSVATVAAVAALAWYVLLGGDPASWVVGVPCVLLCAWFSRTARPGPRAGVAPIGWLRLAPYFLWNSIKGGWDVARRVLSPSLAIDPGLIDYRLGLPQGAARTFFIQFIGLLPGTLGVWREGDCLTVHVLNIDADHERALRDAEERVAAAFALPRVP